MNDNPLSYYGRRIIVFMRFVAVFVQLHILIPAGACNRYVAYVLRAPEIDKNGQLAST